MYRFFALSVCLLSVWPPVAVIASEDQANLTRNDAALAADVKELFRQRCSQCHGGDQQQAGLDVLSLDSLRQNELVVPDDPEASHLLASLTRDDPSLRMPLDAPPLPEDQIEQVRRWIQAGAPDFPEDVPVAEGAVARPEPARETADQASPPAEGNSSASRETTARQTSGRSDFGRDYVLDVILTHQRSLPRDEQVWMRYFSCNHLLAAGTTRRELDLQRSALAKVVNHLSRQARLAPVHTIDGETASVFAVDIRDCGWHVQPYAKASDEDDRAEWNLFDLVLLEYPYAVLPPDSDTFLALAREYLLPAGMVRPVPYVRTDWFCSVATLPPLYHDLLRLPTTRDDLEDQLGVDVEKNIDDGLAKRAAVALSGVSQANRAMERHPARDGYYWRSIDYQSSRGPDNLFADPIHLTGAGGEMIFSLPNGLQGYFICDSQGRRLDEAPTSIVTDKFAADAVVRNGLGCIRCHDRGLKSFRDDVRPAVEQLGGGSRVDKREVLRLYPDRETMDAMVERDRSRFLDAWQAVSRDLGGPIDAGTDRWQEPLAHVSRRYADFPLAYPIAISELGVANHDQWHALFRGSSLVSLGIFPLSAGGVIRRQTWEDLFDDVVLQTGTGVPLRPLDALGRPDHSDAASPLRVTLSSSHSGNVFAPGDDLVLFIRNDEPQDVFVEMIGTGTRGEIVSLVSSGTKISAGETLRFPSTGSIAVQPSLGDEQVTLFASRDSFPGGQVLSAQGITDRFVHPSDLVRIRQNQLQIQRSPPAILKRTLTIQTR